MEEFLKNDENISVIRLCETVVQGETLNNLKSQITSEFETLVVEIASPGGSVSEGLEIMLWLNSLMNEGKIVITVVTANAYSIASLIMLAANIRIISTHGRIMVHNPMIPELEYVNANDLEKHVEELRSLESLMYEIYSSFTKMSFDTIKLLMDNETYLNSEEAVKNGFADKEFEINPRPYVTANNNKNEIDMSKTVNTLNRVLALVNGSELVNQVYYDMEGGKIEIYQMKSASYSKGDKTNLKEGVKKIADGSILTIENFVITDINREEGVVESGDTIIDASAVATEGSEGESNEANEGQENEGESNATEDGENEDVEGAEDGESNEGSEGEQNEGDGEAEPKPKPINMVSLEKFQEMEAKFGEMENFVNTLQKNYDSKIAELKEFENLASETIESIVKNTSSSFKPEARATSTSTGGATSIFRKSLMDAGLEK